MFELFFFFFPPVTSIRKRRNTGFKQVSSFNNGKTSPLVPLTGTVHGIGQKVRPIWAQLHPGHRVRMAAHARYHVVLPQVPHLFSRKRTPSIIKRRAGKKTPHGMQCWQVFATAQDSSQCVSTLSGGENDINRSRSGFVISVKHTNTMQSAE